MRRLHFWKILGVDQLPCSEDVYLMGPNRAYVVECQDQIEQQKDIWRHLKTVCPWPFQFLLPVPLVRFRSWTLLVRVLAQPCSRPYARQPVLRKEALERRLVVWLFDDELLVMFEDRLAHREPTRR